MLSIAYRSRILLRRKFPEAKETFSCRKVSEVDYSENKMLLEKGVRSRIVSPLIILGKVIGTLDVGAKMNKFI